MKHRTHLLGWALTFLTVAQACGGSGDSSSGTNGGNFQPVGGSSGAGGSSNAGSGGSSNGGASGQSGNSGSSGKAGSSAAGTAGASGASGQSGSGGSAGSGAGGNGGSSFGGASGSNSFGGASGSAGTMQQDPIVSVTISPQNPTIEVLNGVVPAPITFIATGITQMGSMVPLTGVWSYDAPEIGTIGAGNGDFSATGLYGGIGTVSFQDNLNLGLSATTTASVKYKIVMNPINLDPSTIVSFGLAANTDPTMSLLYPYNNTVFPRGLQGPTVQWNGGGDSDVYSIHAASTYYEFQYYGAFPNPSRFDWPTVDGTTDNSWKKLSDSTTGDIEVSIQRFNGSEAFLPVTQTWKIAPANLAGIVYYWEVNNGDVVRLPIGANAPEHFLQKPAGVSCIACHSVSHDGSTLVAAFNGSASPWGTFDTASGTPVYVSGVDPNNGPAGSGFQAISPNGDLVLFGQERAYPYLSLSAFNNAAEISQMNPNSGYPVHPAWSKDGNRIAFASRYDGNWLDFTQSTLWITDVDLATGAFSNIHQIVANDGGRPTVTFPTFTPDSAWIAFERATQARTRGAQSDIWLTSVDGASQIALDTLNGVGTLQPYELSANYEPTMMPVSVGGYYWLVIVSERTYGNTLTDTNPTTRKKQLWVSAIDPNIAPGADPSHPPFWLPGQELTNQNMRGEWVLAPCKAAGNSCSAGYECCDGHCIQGPNGAVCGQGSGCSVVGDICATSADCCDAGATCIGGYCSIKEE